jgi:hypothetical protein
MDNFAFMHDKTMNHQLKTLLFILLILFVIQGCHNPGQPDQFVAGVNNPVISLNGPWEINLHPAGEFWKADTAHQAWQPIRVPGEPMMQGFAIRHDTPFAYRKKIFIPADFTGQTIRLRFDGVYNYARVWVNGEYVRDHHGGFTRWECDVSGLVLPGEAALVVVEVTDRADGISYGSGYAKHMIGGILRDVSLRALPPVHPAGISIITDLDENYKNANLLISGKMTGMPEDGKIRLALTDPYNSSIPLQYKEVAVSDTNPFIIRNVMRSPHKWDAEHPNLYELTLAYFEKNELVYQNVWKVGFREVEIKGNKMLVNGKEVKLRGANRHDIHPLLGRVSTPEYEHRDVRLAKEANMNFIRTSHYPPTENFLSLCDKYGLYVEDETAVCFVGSHRTAAYYPGASENDTTFTERYLSQLEEMVVHHRNHPAVILWSIGNENSFGTNFRLSYDWVKATDPTRPVIFSYPGHVPDSIKAYDVLSMHYPGIAGNMNQLGQVTKGFGHPDMPVIFDEWAHVACYNNFTVMEDPNIRDFWGRSLDSMWTRVFEADGGLGGAIWGMIDETFMLPDTLPGYNAWWGIIDPHVIPAAYSGHTVGYGEWGIIDTWRRKKPEFWNTRKAYTPFKVLQTRFESGPSAGLLEVPVHNRFDHTNFRELKIKYTYKGSHRIANAPDIPPHETGTLRIPIEAWDPAETIRLEARDYLGRLIDSYTLRLDQQPAQPLQAGQTGSIESTETATLLRLSCSGNTGIIFDKATGLVRAAGKKDSMINIAGPYFNLRTRGAPVIYSYHQINDYRGWELLDFNWEEVGETVIIRTKGRCSDSLAVSFTMSITPGGELGIRYEAEGIPPETIRELGVRFQIGPEIDAISWEREGYWSHYPDLHLSALKGTQALYPQELKKYRAIPPKEWAFDTKSFYYSGTENESKGTLAFRAKATRENIREYSLLQAGKKVLTVMGEGDVHCRLAGNEDILDLYISNEMDYVDLSWGNYQREIVHEGSYVGKVQVMLFDGKRQIISRAEH